MPRIIAHLDMDAFFAAIEERDTPAFRGVPLVVGADPRGGQGRGVAATSNYLARAYGIQSATPISKAWHASESARRAGKPPVTFVSVDMPKYLRVSEEVLKIVRRYMPIVEQASIDEAYGDLSQTGCYEAAEALCLTVKNAIRAEQQLTASIGIGPNKLIAKIASGLHKPDGLTVVREEETESFLEPLPVRIIPGIGPKSEERFRSLGIQSVRDAKQFTLFQLVDMMGKRGAGLYDHLRGMDFTPLDLSSRPKTIGEQATFEADTDDSQVLMEQLMALSKGVITRLHLEGFQSFRTIALTVRFADFETKSRAHTLTEPASEHATVWREALKLLMPFLDRRENPQRKLVRLLGLRVEKLQ